MKRSSGLLIAAAVFLTRLPFLAAGYGMDADADRIVVAGRCLATTGRYSVSRFPGYPIPEAAAALLWRGGPLAENGATALIASLGIMLFFRALGAMGCRLASAGALALAFTPIVYVHSTTAMDYLWALAALLAALDFVIRGRPWLAGVMLGIATGCRITSILWLAPLGLVILLARGGGKVADLVRLCGSAAAVASLAYLPVFLTYGPGFLSYAGSPAATPPSEIAASATTGVWGAVGVVALFLALGWTLTVALLGKLDVGPFRGLARSAETAIPRNGSVPFLVSSAAGLALYGALFWILPRESGYLIAAVPFAIVLLAGFLDRRVFGLVCLALVISPFAGPILEDHSRRLEMDQSIAGLVSRGDRMTSESVIVVGAKNLPRMKSRLKEPALGGDPGAPPATNRVPLLRGAVTYVSRLEETRFRELSGRGVAVYYLEEARPENRIETGFDLSAAGAQPLEPL